MTDKINKSESKSMKKRSWHDKDDENSSPEGNVTVTPGKKKKKTKKEKADSSEVTDKSVESSNTNLEKNKSHHKKQKVEKEPKTVSDNPSETEETKRKKKSKKKIPSILSNSLGTVDNDLVQNAEKNLQVNGLDIESTTTPEKPESSKKPRKKKKKKKSGKQVQEPAEKKSDQNSNSRHERALSYLHTWNSDKGSWKFNKMNQILLFHMMYETSVINEDDFQILLLYLAGMKGKAKEVTHNQALKIVNGETENGEEISAVKEQRAREIVQVLS